jgi:hypothetical protein
MEEGSPGVVTPAEEERESLSGPLKDIKILLNIYRTPS